MCQAPGILPNGVLIPCRKCWQCRSVRLDDWTGRAIAEKKMATASSFVTLTYGVDDRYGAIDHERAAVLTYSDIQKYLKRLRRAGYKFRYMAVGEYGSKKGRAHWHLLIWWHGAAYRPEQNKRIDCEFWPHGFAQYEDLGEAGVMYVCKYLRKDESDRGQVHMSVSKKPPIGAGYFQHLAARYAHAAIAPPDLVYGWPDVRTSEGKQRRFLMQGATVDIFARAFLNAWAKYQPGRHVPPCEWLELWQDKQNPYVRGVDLKAIRREVKPWVMPEGAGPLQWNERTRRYECDAGGETMVWIEDEGKYQWMTKSDAAAGGRNDVQSYSKASRGE